MQQRWRAAGAAGLRLAPIGTGMEHMFIVLNRPLDGSAAGLGRDMSQALEPAEALRAARSSGEVAASRTYVLIKDRDLPAAQQQMSFLLTAPVRGGAGAADAGRFRGWVFLSMRGSDFIAETLRTRSQGAVSVALLDVSGAESRTVVKPPSTPTRHTAALDRRRTVAVGQRTWQLRMTATDALLSANDRRMPALVAVTGTVMTLLLTTLFGVLISTRNRAMSKVEQATAALRDDIEHRKHIEATLREREDELQHQATHDALTGLANRALFHHRVEKALHTHDHPDTAVAVLFIDLDGFKQVNDQRGHDAGDAVLIEVAARLRACVRAGDTVARLGGDEFAILAEHLTAPEHGEVVASHVVQALQTPIDLDGGPVGVTASVGVAYRQDPTCTTDDIVRRADAAMYHAKHAGKNGYRVTGSPVRPVSLRA